MITGWQSRLLPLGNRVYHYPEYVSKGLSFTYHHLPAGNTFHEIHLPKGEDVLYGFNCRDVALSDNFDLHIETMILKVRDKRFKLAYYDLSKDVVCGYLVKGNA